MTYSLWSCYFKISHCSIQNNAEHLTRQKQLLAPSSICAAEASTLAPSKGQRSGLLGKFVQVEEIPVVSLGRVGAAGVMNSGLGILSLNSLVIGAGLCWASGHRQGGQGGDEHRGGS